MAIKNSEHDPADVAEPEQPVKRPTPVRKGGSAVPEDDQFIYCGPSIPGGRLNENAILKGTRAEVLAFYADVLERYPQVKHLIVSVHQLAETKHRIRTPGNIAHKHYSDIASLLRGGKEGV